MAARNPSRRTAASKTASARSATSRTKGTPARKATARSAATRNRPSARTANRTARTTPDSSQDTRRRVLQQIDSGASRAAAQLGGMAAHARETAEHLRENDNEPMAHVVDLAAERTGRFAAYLSRADSDSMATSFENLARSRPWLVTAGALTTGYLLGRMLSAMKWRRRGGRYLAVGSAPELMFVQEGKRHSADGHAHRVAPG